MPLGDPRMGCYWKMLLGRALTWVANRVGNLAIREFTGVNKALVMPQTGVVNVGCGHTGSKSRFKSQDLMNEN